VLSAQYGRIHQNEVLFATGMRKIINK
jgi:hypothetical protein